MNWKTKFLILLFSGVLSMGCSSGTNPPVDAGTDAGVDAGTDGGADGGADDGGDVTVITSRTRVNITAGGGTTQSDNYKARIHIGAPQPFGTTESTGSKLQAGPRPTK